MLKRKDKIIISAIELLNEEGISGVTTKNLASRQNVTEPALYRQFSGKQEILNHILDEYAAYDEKIEKTILQSTLVGKEAVTFYVTRYAELYQNYSELTTVMFSMDLYYYNESSRIFMKELNEKRLRFLEDLIEKKKDDFSLGQKFTSKELASVIIGTIFSQVYEWRMCEKEYVLGERLLGIISRLL